MLEAGGMLNALKYCTISAGRYAYTRRHVTSRHVGRLAGLAWLGLDVFVGLPARCWVLRGMDSIGSIIFFRIAKTGGAEKDRPLPQERSEIRFGKRRSMTRKQGWVGACSINSLSHSLAVGAVQRTIVSMHAFRSIDRIYPARRKRNFPKTNVIFPRAGRLHPVNLYLPDRNGRSSLSLNALCLWRTSTQHLVWHRPYCTPYC